MINMFSKCGTLEDALDIYRAMQKEGIQPNVVTWNTLVSAHVQHGESEKALQLFDQMKQASCPPNAITYNCVLQACIYLRDFKRGKHEFDQFLHTGLIATSLMLNTYIKLHAICGTDHDSNHLLDTLRKCTELDVALWTKILRVYIIHGTEQVFCSLLEQMDPQLTIDEDFYIELLTACTTKNNLKLGQTLYQHFLKQ